MDVVFLAWFVLAKLLLRFLYFYLFLGGIWVHVVAEKDLLRLFYVYGACCHLPVFWQYLGTCYDQKEST